MSQMTLECMIACLAKEYRDKQLADFVALYRQAYSQATAEQQLMLCRKLLNEWRWADALDQLQDLFIG